MISVSPMRRLGTNSAGKAALSFFLVFFALIIFFSARGMADEPAEETEKGEELAESGRAESVKLQTSLQADEKEILTPAPVREVGEQKVLLEGVIGHGAYVLGPGDALLLRAWGKTNIVHTLEIDPEGKVIVPNVGEIAVAGKPLDEAKKEIIQAFRKFLKDVPVSVSLARLRVFKVYLLGEVARPGMYRASGTTRVSEVIQDAGGLTRTGSRRNIELRRTGGHKFRVDLDAFSFIGSLDKNPTLSGGDVIFVPPRQHTFTVFGGVHRPGEYEFAQGDGVKDVVALAGGVVEDALPSRVEVTRFVGDTATDSLFVDLNDPDSVKGSAEIVIQPRDRVFVRSILHWREAKNVTVEGEVNFPGVYAIEEGRDSAKDILRRAGGLTVDADLETAYLSREYFGSEDPELERLLKKNTGELQDLEYQYLRTRLRGKQAVFSRSLKSILEDKTSGKEFLLRHGDKIVVPQKELMVRIIGEVKSPGLVPYKEGKGAGYYVKSAGGFTKRAKANTVKVFRAGQGQPFSSDDIDKVEPGDTVWIPEKPEVNLWERTREIIGLLAQVSTVILVISQATAK